MSSSESKKKRKIERNIQKDIVRGNIENEKKTSIMKSDETLHPFSTIKSSNKKL